MRQARLGVARRGRVSPGRAGHGAARQGKVFHQMRSYERNQSTDLGHHPHVVQSFH